MRATLLLLPMLLQCHSLSVALIRATPLPCLVVPKALHPSLPSKAPSRTLQRHTHARADARGRAPISQAAGRRELLAELIGTGMITFFGTGVVAASVYLGAMNGLWQVAVVWGIAVMLAAFCTVPISGGHLNPAVTLAMVIFRGFPMGVAICYVLAQVCGATAAAAGVLATFRPAIEAFELSHQIQRGTALGISSAPGCMFYTQCLGGITSGVTACILEAVQQAVLTFVILSVTHKESNAGRSAPALIGLTVSMLICVFGPLTAAGINPARDLGPRIVAVAAGWGTYAFKHCWVYAIGPLIGTIVGGAVHRELYDAR